MGISAANLEIIKELPDNAKVGIVGVPPLKVIEIINKKNIFDLDEAIVKQNIEETILYLPRVYCAILRTVMLNALHLELDAVIIDTGRGKCDAALHIAAILNDKLDIPVIQTRNHDSLDFGTPLCDTQMPLIDKINAICTGIQNTSPHISHNPCIATAGFWGVPPRDFSILKLFPDTTHVFGWTRCMENKTPDNWELEMKVNRQIPTIFFGQSFCAKTALAKHLASQHPRGLFLDSDVFTGNSTKAKIQAFLELSGVTNAPC
jgi:hypothetical protein